MTGDASGSVGVAERASFLESAILVNDDDFGWCRLLRSPNRGAHRQLHRVQGRRRLLAFPHDPLIALGNDFEPGSRHDNSSFGVDSALPLEVPG